MKNKIQALIKFLNLYASDDHFVDQCISDLNYAIDESYDESDLSFLYDNILSEMRSDYLDLFLTTYADENSDKITK